jgi:hypothetical protein
VNVAAEAEISEIVDQTRAEPAATVKPGQFIFGEAQAFEKRQRLFQSGCHEEIPLRRQLPNEEFEHGGISLA